MSIRSPDINSNSSSKFPSFADHPPVIETPPPPPPVIQAPPPPVIQAPPVIIENIPDVAPDYCKINDPDINNGQDTYLGVSTNKYLDGSLINDNNILLRIYSERDCQLMNGRPDMNNGNGYKGECIILNEKGESNGSYTNMCGNAPPNNGAKSPDFECPLGYSKIPGSPYNINFSNNIVRIVNPNLNTPDNYVCMANPTEKTNVVKYNSYKQKQDTNGNIIVGEDNSNTTYNSLVCPVFDNNSKFKYWKNPEISMINNNLVCTTTLSQSDVGRSQGMPMDEDKTTIKNNVFLNNDSIKSGVSMSISGRANINSISSTPFGASAGINNSMPGTPFGASAGINNSMPGTPFVGVGASGNIYR
jgi:hypothetical protein